MRPQLVVSIKEQSLKWQDSAEAEMSFPISSSKFGLGTKEGSNCTPLGRFRICEKYGARSPLYTSFKGRCPVSVWNPEEPSEEDFVLSRIFRLEGLSSELTNTNNRYIYFHGTNQEDLIGTPASHGCIRMKNADIAMLYPLVPVGTEVIIED